MSYEVEYKQVDEEEIKELYQKVERLTRQVEDLIKTIDLMSLNPTQDEKNFLDDQEEDPDEKFFKKAEEEQTV